MGACVNVLVYVYVYACLRAYLSVCTLKNRAHSAAGARVFSARLHVFRLQRGDMRLRGCACACVCICIICVFAHTCRAHSAGVTGPWRAGQTSPCAREIHSLVRFPPLAAR